MKSRLVRTNIAVAGILLIGFAVIATLHFYSFYKDAMLRIYRESSQEISGIYAKMSSLFIKEVSISTSMANDGFLISYLSDDKSYAKKDFESVITSYLQGCQKIYGFDAAFLSLTRNKALYSQKGFDRILSDDAASAWYNAALAHDRDYDINIDTDKFANNEISIFVNCKIKDRDGRLIGIIGVCIHVDKIVASIRDFEKATGAQVKLVNEGGIIEISSDRQGFERVDWFSVNGNKKFREQFAAAKQEGTSSEMASFSGVNPVTENYITVKYLPELSWFLVVEHYTGSFFRNIKKSAGESALVFIAVLLAVLFVISRVIRGFETQLKNMLEEKQRHFHDATGQMYKHIYEVDITGDRFAPDSELRRFAGLDADGLSYSENLRLAAERLVKEGFREDFLEAFSRESILREFSRGVDHINREIPLAHDGKGHQWHRFNAFVFTEDEQGGAVHMYLYVRNVDAEMKKAAQARTDALSQCLSRGAAEQGIEECLAAAQDHGHVFFIIDVDNFKRANDTFGHAFGDACIRQFAAAIRGQFRTGDLIGRIGGDEFVVLIPCPDEEWARDKAATLVQALDMDCVLGDARMHISASVGAAMYPVDGMDFATLYRKADTALYAVKENGKNNVRFYAPEENDGAGGAAGEQAGPADAA